jgi:nifR3 family TIM-barrel protein
MNLGFWKNLKSPIIAHSPMDGVSDAAYRFITDKYGKPDILITEFTTVEGISHGATRILQAFIHHQTETPTVAQLYGTSPEAFYNATFVVCEMGFDGVDINMGCPSPGIASRGAGAGLIRTPELAQTIIKTVKQAVKDYSEGKTIHDTSLPKDIIKWVENHKSAKERRHLPVSVKTRIGYEDIVTEEWISTILEMEPAAITIHGRTLKQMYTGFANWEEIGKAAKLVKKTETKILGNGDIRTLDDAKEKIEKYKVDGVLIGRGTYGNPWIFKNHTPTKEEQIKTALEHCEAFAKLTPDGHFLSLRKHLAWYTKGIHGSNELRNKLMSVTSVEDVREILANS